MFCFNCGKQIPDDSLFCPYCGTNQQPSDHFPEEADHEEQNKSAAARSVSYVNNEVKAVSKEALSHAGAYVGDLKTAFYKERDNVKSMLKDSINLFKSGSPKKNNK